jgi:cyclin H
MEDETYLQSTQYRYFTFTPKKLSDLRRHTNAIASQRLHDDLQSAILAGDITPTPDTADPSPDKPVPASILDQLPLTAEEELKLVAHYATTCVKICEHFKTGSAVKATALTFLQRIYLRISPLQIHPKTLLLPILFLALKSETGMQSASEFIRTAAEIGLKTTKEELLSPEINIAMNLRWAFKVLHPYRGVEGVKLELLAIAQGTYRSPGGGAGEGVEVKAAFEAIGGGRERVEKAWRVSRSLLTGPALLTDVYFLYTPAQVTLAGVWAADREVAEFYLGMKIKDGRVREKLTRVVRECAEWHLLAQRGEENPYPGLLLRLPQNGVAMGVEVEQEIHKEVKPCAPAW